MYGILLCVDITCPESQNWNHHPYELPIWEVCFITIINRQTSAWAENTQHPLSYFYALLQIYISEQSPSSPQESWMFERQWVTGEGEHGHDKPGSTRLPQQWIKHPVFLSLEGITERQFEGFFFQWCLLNFCADSHPNGSGFSSNGLFFSFSGGNRCQGHTFKFLDTKMVCWEDVSLILIFLREGWRDGGRRLQGMTTQHG